MEPDQQAPAALQRFAVDVSDAGARLDIFLTDRLRLSRAQARRLLDSGAVTIDGRRVGKRHKGDLLGAGGVIEVRGFEHPAEVRVFPEPAAQLRELASGPGWVVMDKPAGMPVHPLRDGETGTLLNALVARYPYMDGVGEGGLRSGVVHRLDVETSGVLLFATEQHAWERLRRAFQEHRTTKLYRALVRGRLTGGGHEVMDLFVAQHHPARVRIVEPGASGARQPPGARRCDLSWRALEWLPGATLLEVKLGTGFLHQIRVMLAHLGHPLVGDKIYGSNAAAPAAPRPLLHAARLAVEEVEASSPDPPDLTAVFARLRG